MTKLNCDHLFLFSYVEWFSESKCPTIFQLQMSAHSNKVQLLKVIDNSNTFSFLCPRQQREAGKCDTHFYFLLNQHWWCKQTLNSLLFLDTRWYRSVVLIAKPQFGMYCRPDIKWNLLSFLSSPLNRIMILSRSAQWILMHSCCIHISQYSCIQPERFKDLDRDW